MSRVGRIRYFSEMAKLVASRSTCMRRSVGCVLVDDRGHVLATGYNGVPQGQPHCTSEPCPGANAESGSRLEECRAVHAEANAVLQCADVSRVDTCYVTASPCVFCARLLLNTSCRRIVFGEKYSHAGSAGEWISSGRTWVLASARPLVVGERPGSLALRDDDDALTADRGGSGLRLASLCGLGAIEWASAWMRVNLLGFEDQWNDHVACDRALSVTLNDVPMRPAVVLLGRRVQRAFGLSGDDTIARTARDGVDYWSIPHPSGRNRWWNDPANVEAARAVMSGITREVE